MSQTSVATEWECLGCAKVIDASKDDTCPFCGIDVPCPHKWAGQPAGGPPDMAESYEWVCYCEYCGMEQPGSYDEPLVRE